MTNLFNTLKNALGGSADKRPDCIRKALRSLGYAYADHGAYISCELAADNTLRYKSQIVLRPNGDDPTISLIYTIYGKRISHDEPFRSPEAQAAIKGYGYQTNPDYLMYKATLDGKDTTAKGIAGAVRRIREVALATYTDAGIPADPDEAVGFGGVSLKTIKDTLTAVGLKTCKEVSDDYVVYENEYFSHADRVKLLGFGIRIVRQDADVAISAYFDTIALPLEQAKKLAEKFASAFKQKGEPDYTATEISYMVAYFDGFDKNRLIDTVNCAVDAYREFVADVKQAALEAYERNVSERKRQQEQAEARAREAERERGLSQCFTLTLTRDMSIRSVQRYFTEDYPYLTIGFYLLKNRSRGQSERRRHISDRPGYAVRANPHFPR